MFRQNVNVCKRNRRKEVRRDLHLRRLRGKRGLLSRAWLHPVRQRGALLVLGEFEDDILASIPGLIVFATSIERTNYYVALVRIVVVAFAFVLQAFNQPADLALLSIFDAYRFR